MNRDTKSGAASLVVSTGGTEGGTYTAMPTKFNLNTTGTQPTGSTTVTVGGTHTGGTEREVLKTDSSTLLGGAGNGNRVPRTRLLAAGTHYIDITVTGTTAGMHSIEWEEMP